MNVVYATTKGTTYGATKNYTVLLADLGRNLGVYVDMFGEVARW